MASNADMDNLARYRELLGWQTNARTIDSLRSLIREIEQRLETEKPKEP